MKIIYLSGPISGIEDLNRYNFKSAYFRFKNGPNVINPHDISDKLKFLQFLPDKISWYLYMFFDLIALLFCYKIYMLDGWGNSRGAKIELKVAKFMKMEIEYEQKNGMTDEFR